MNIEEAINILTRFKDNIMQEDKLEEDNRCDGLKIGIIYKYLVLSEAIETVLKELDRKDVLNKASAEVIENSILKDKIREKIKELDKQYKEYATKWENSGMDKQHPFYIYITRLEAEIDILQELLKESD